MSDVIVPMADSHSHVNATARNHHRVAFAAEHGVSLPSKYIQADGGCREWSKSPHESHEVYNASSALIRTPENIYTITNEYLVNAAKLGCVYVDLHSSCMNPPNTFAVNATATLEAMQDAYRNTGIESSLAVTFKRHHREGVDAARVLLNHMLDFKDKGLDKYNRMNATDMAGNENISSPTTFLPIYQRIVKELGFTNNGIHAGETSTPDDIYAALDLPGITRIGHGLAAIKDNALMDLMKQRNIMVEMLLTSNEMLLKYKPDAHPIREYFNRGIADTLGPDDPGIMGITIADEYQKARDKYGFNNSELLLMTVNAIRHGFAPIERLETAMAKVIAANDEHGLGLPTEVFDLRKPVDLQKVIASMPSIAIEPKRGDHPQHISRFAYNS